MSRDTCILSNTLRLAIVVALWIIGTMLGQWDMDIFTFIIFGFIYLAVESNCSCGCGEKKDADEE